MNYFKSLSLNFLTVFFADHILPGLDVMNQTRLPHIGGDLIFAAALGFLNSLIFPLLRLIGQEATPLRIGLISIILNFAAYGVVKLIPIGVVVLDVEGYILASSIVTIASFLTNYFEMKYYRNHKVDLSQ